MRRKERIIKSSNHKGMEDKNRNKKQGQQVENSNKYGRYSSNHIKNNF